MLDALVQNVRYALRLLRRAPGFTTVIVTTLALGIGANTAIFTIIDGLLLRSLPVKEPERLALVLRDAGSNWTYPIWEQIRARADMFDGALAWSTFDGVFNLSNGGEARFVNGVWVSASAFPTLGIDAALGRTFVPEDDRRGGGPDGPVAVISYAFWQRHFGGAPDAIGRTLTLDRVPFTVVGVTPAGFTGLTVGRPFDVAVPFGVEPLLRGANESRLDRRTSWWVGMMLRLKPGQTLDQATALLRTVQPQIRDATLPADVTRADLAEYLKEPFALTSAAAGRSGLREQYRRPLIVIMIAVALVLLIACANIANLLLARATARSHEWSVRLALGASRTRLACQLLTESLLMAAMGSAAALLIARWVSDVLVRQLSSESVSLDLTLDWRVLAFTAATTIVTVIMFGLAPALRAAHEAPIDAMKARGRGNAWAGPVSAAGGLVVLQVALSVVLVASAGLFARTFAGLASASLGFETNRVLLVDVNALGTEIPPLARTGVYERIRQRVEAVPGVASAGVSLISPVSGAIWSRRVDLAGSVIPAAERSTGPEGFGFTDARIPSNEPLAVFNAISPDWLSTYRTRLVAGRDISTVDGASSARVALVNEAFARKFLNGANPIGRTLRTMTIDRPAPREIVGLVADAVYRDVREPILPTVYIPLAQLDRDPAMVSPPAVALAIRASSGSAAALTRSVAAAIAEINPRLTLTFTPLADQVSDTFVQERLLAMLSGFFGALALLLAAIGLYGLTSYAVGLRRAEIAIRMALGATRASVIHLVMRRVTMLLAAGIPVGLVVSVWASRFVATLLYGLEPGDPLTLAWAAAALAAVGAIAGWIPAWRASRLEPTILLQA